MNDEQIWSTSSGTEGFDEDRKSFYIHTDEGENVVIDEIEPDQLFRRIVVILGIAGIVAVLVALILSDGDTPEWPVSIEPYQVGQPQFQFIDTVRIPYQVKSTNNETGEERVTDFGISLIYRGTVHQKDWGVPVLTVIPLKAEAVKIGP